jgi:hypothetical protein
MTDNTTASKNNAIRADHTERVQSLCVLNSSQKNYEGKLNAIKVFLRSNGLEHLIDGENNIMVPLDYNTVLSPLFSWPSTNTELLKRKNWTSSITNTSNNEEIVGRDILF